MMGAHLEGHRQGTPHGRSIFRGQAGVDETGGGCAPLRNGDCLREGSETWIQT